MLRIPALTQLWVALQPAEAISATRLKLRQHLEAAIDWLELAHLQAGDGGISKGYNLLRNDFAPSYPETAGYIIPTLLNAADALGRPELGRC